MARKKKRWTLNRPKTKKVLRAVPAHIDGEEVGVTIHYKDGTMTFMQYADLSDNAIKKMAIFRELNDRNR